MLSYDSRANYELLGELRIPLSKLKDQYRHDEWFDLYDRSGHLAGGKIHLILQWIHSKAKYLSDVVKKWNDHIRMQQEDKSDYERDLKTLYEAFTSLVREYEKFKAKATTNLKVSQKGFSPVKGGLDRVDTMLTIEFPHLGTWGKAAFYGTLALLFLSLLGCFSRADYVDVSSL